MDIDVEALLAPVSEDDPVGSDLDGSPERYAIEEPFQLEQQAGEGDEVLIDWRDVVRRIVSQFGETKDLWLGVYLMRAGARLGDLEAVVAGARLNAGMLERYWETVHPQLEQVDFIGRKAPFESLTKIRDFLNPLKQVVLVQHPRLGRYTIADVQRMAQDGEGAEGYGMFQAALSDMPADEVEGVRDKVDALIEGIRQVDATLTMHAAGDTSTNFEPTYDALRQIREAVDVFVYVKEPEAAGEDGGDADLSDLDDLDLDSLLGDLGGDEAGGESGGADDLGDLGDLDSLLADLGGDDADESASPTPAPAPRAVRGPVATPRKGGAGGAITSRADALAALQAVESWYRANEPSNPIAALVARARTWADMDFLALIKDLTPNSETEVRSILGIRDDSSNGY